MYLLAFLPQMFVYLDSSIWSENYLIYSYDFKYTLYIMLFILIILNIIYYTKFEENKHVILFYIFSFIVQLGIIYLIAIENTLFEIYYVSKYIPIILSIQIGIIVTFTIPCMTGSEKQYTRNDFQTYKSITELGGDLWI